MNIATHDVAASFAIGFHRNVFTFFAVELPRWRKCQALLKFKREERKVLREEGEEEEFSDEVIVK